MAHAPSFQFARPGQTDRAASSETLSIAAELLLSRTRELVALRGRVRQLERECRAIIMSLLCDEQA